MSVNPNSSLNRRRLTALVELLGPIADEIVFIGRSVAELLQVDPLLPRACVTKDVDAVVAVTSHRDYERITVTLCERGLRGDMREGAHAHRWRAGDDAIFDLVPVGPGAPGGGGHWDKIALRTAEREQLDEHVSLWRASAPVFLAMKWNAFADRGNGDWFMSHDVEDILAVIAGRPLVVAEIAAAEDDVREYVASQCKQLLALDDVDSIVEGALSSARQLVYAIGAVRERLVAVAAMAG